MKIYITANILEAFWNHFEPKGLISLASMPWMGGTVCIVDVKRWEASYTEEEISKVYEEVRQWVPVAH